MKTYKISEHNKETCAEELILNEIRFLRELKVCSNIVQLESVYIKQLPGHNTKAITLVMKLAKYGSIHKQLVQRRVFTED